MHCNATNATLKKGELIHGRETAQEDGKEDEEGGEDYYDDDLMMLVMIMI